MRCEQLRMLLLLLITWRRGRRLLLSMLLLRIPRSGQRRCLRNLGRLRLHLLHGSQRGATRLQRRA